MGWLSIQRCIPPCFKEFEGPFASCRVRSSCRESVIQAFVGWWMSWAGAWSLIRSWSHAERSLLVDTGCTPLKLVVGPWGDSPLCNTNSPSRSTNGIAPSERKEHVLRVERFSSAGLAVGIQENKIYLHLLLQTCAWRWERGREIHMYICTLPKEV